MKIVLALLMLLGFAGAAQAQKSLNVGGYYINSCSGGCTSASVNLVVPSTTFKTGSSNPDQYFAWIGIDATGGATSTACPTGCLGQFGVYDIVTSGGTHTYHAWTELACGGGVPAACGPETEITGFPVNPGDVVNLTMTCIVATGHCVASDAAQTWHVVVTNITQQALSTACSVWDNTVGNACYGIKTFTWPLALSRFTIGVEGTNSGGGPDFVSPMRWSNLQVGFAGGALAAFSPEPVPTFYAYQASGSGATETFMQPSIPIGGNGTDFFVCSVRQTSFVHNCFQGAYSGSNNPGLGP